MVLRSYDSKKNRQELQCSYELQNVPCKLMFLQGLFQLFERVGIKKVYNIFNF